MLDVQSSFVIGGVLMLSLLGLNLTLSNSHNQLSSGHISQSTADELMVVIRNDFHKIGHGVVGQNPIQTFDSTQIVFFADLDDDGDVERVEYALSDTTAAAQTSNPHDRYLYRIIDMLPPQGVALGVVDFRLVGFDELGNETMAPETLRTLEITLEVEATDPIDRTYNRAIRRARVSPVPLQFD